MSLGAFEQAVLLAVAHLGDNAYGVTIRREIERRTAREVATGALYTALDRLQEKGYLTSHLSAPTRERGGRAKRHYEVTGAGRGALRESREFLARMWAGLKLAPERGRS